MRKRLAKWFWLCPEWMHVLLWALTHYVSVKVWMGGKIVAYQWDRWDRLHYD